MNRIKIHLFILLMITIAAIGLLIDSLLEGWEFWVNPLLVAGVIVMWVLHVGQILSESAREALYLGYGMFMAFFHGVHLSSFYDICAVITLMLILFSLYDRFYVLNLILAEYFILVSLQFIFVVTPEVLSVDSVTVSRLCLQLMIVLSVYFICRMIIRNRLDQRIRVERRDEEIEAYDSDMEDFLSNISHELRTPVNVVNGMSSIMQKQGKNEELDAIAGAGLRLSYQIEDIQDYTEVKRDKLIVENENYMITSLINDVVVDFRRYTGMEELELVVDLAPDVPSMLNGDVRKIKKILRHLLDNAIKFTKQGGIFIKVFAEPKDYGINLCMEVTDTGIGMKRRDISKVSAGMYQANKKRNRSSGGIGLGLPIVYGLVHKMGGFIKIEPLDSGTTVRVTIPQSVAEKKPCLAVDISGLRDIVFHVKAGKYKVPAVREFYREMATDLATGIRKPLYSADSPEEVKRLMEKLEVSHIFMGEEEYEDSREFFDGLSSDGKVVVTVSARPDFTASAGSNVIVMPKPLYGFPVVKVLNGERPSRGQESNDGLGRPRFDGVKALIVDDEPMNLIVATGMFREYGMITDTALSGRESLDKYVKEKYDIIFMDHMMPEMDGVEVMKIMKDIAKRKSMDMPIVALTANAVSGAREMFIREGFDGFIAKPVDLMEFERVMRRVLPADMITYEGRKSDEIV